MNVFSSVVRVAADAELRTVKGQSVANVRLASDTGSGEHKGTLWVNGAVWGIRGEKLAPMLLKGTQLFVSGEIAQRDYTSKEGIKGQSLELRISELQFVGAKVERQEAPAKGWHGPHPSRPAELQDEIPF